MRIPVKLGIAASLLLAPFPVLAADGIGKIVEGVPAANKDVGTPASLLDPDFQAILLATGTDPLENPSGPIRNFGYLSDLTGTEPDQNLYLEIPQNIGGPDKAFNYGHHFLFQGHENGNNLAYVTRINLDVTRGDKHRITLLTPVDPVSQTTGFGSIDGSTYDPFTKTLLFTQELGTSSHTGQGKVIQITLSWPPVVTTLEAFLGLGGYEGIHPDSHGNIYLVEDIGGVTNSTTKAKQPNSFVYRYVPNDPTHIEKGGQLQALQVSVDGTPVTFHAADPDGDTNSVAQLKLHTYGTSYPAKWVTIHTSNEGDTASFDANQAAKDAGATPFKRPENMAWIPSTNFKSFFFDPTGDTDSTAGGNPDLAARGAYGAIFRVDLDSVGGDGKISIFALGDAEHNSFDNLAMADETTLLSTEDRGDTLHTQLNTLDSVWAYSLNTRSSVPFSSRNALGTIPKAIRFVALGRDASAVSRKEDNEPTGLFVSRGGITIDSLLGTQKNLINAQAFLTRQHGDNSVFAIFHKK